jgi:ATP synthase protein I
MEHSKNDDQDIFSKRVGEQEKRKLNSQSEIKRSTWSGFGLFGIVGWSVVAPTLAGAAFGSWLDKNYPQESISWTLSFLIIGLVIGCLTAWHWINKEHKEMHLNKEKKNE